MTAEYKVHGAVAVITLNNPPVNGLGHATRSAIVEGMKQAQNDDAVKAVVITGAGKAFSGGADIREFNTPKALAEPARRAGSGGGGGAGGPGGAAGRAGGGG